MSKYSFKFKEEVVRKKLSGRPVMEIVKETGVSDVTIYAWAKQFAAGNLTEEDYSPRSISIPEKYKLLTECFSTPSESRGEWQRKNGVHPDHLEKWNTEIKTTLMKPSKEKEEIKKLKVENQRLEKELKKKDKALAEAAALLVLKKKYQHLWEDEEK